MPEFWKDDEELFAIARRELFTAVVGDVMDKMGLFHQFLSPAIKPLREEMVVIGRAMTVLQIDCFEETRPGNPNIAMQQPFGLMFKALDDLKPNEVYVSSGGQVPQASWGELMSTRAKRLGAAGTVTNGYHRDTRGILKLNFPTFSMGAYAADRGSRGKIMDYRCRLDIGGVIVNDGDIIFGDVDGVCVIPKEAEVEAFTLALDKARGEKLVRKAIEGGMSATEAYTKFGIM
ncbi:MAG: RraA family protein [Planctomycetota bacterium]|nr:RraA family protein [Planctomycetota bacterium]MDA1139383.1 RraA family protein [Planctomycetota bacterium]